jgi:predicted amidohydrolase YtcJ
VTHFQGTLCPDTLFFGGAVLTQDAAQPRADALLVRGERIAYVGSRAEAEARATPDAVRVDLAGRCLCPGFHDAHVHLTQHGLDLARLRLFETQTLDDALSLVEARAQAQEPGSWIAGSGLSMSRWNVTALDKRDLDRVSPAHPVVLRSQDGHSVWANSLALARAGIGRETPDPEHGVIERNAAGEPTGRLLELATKLLDRALPQPSDAELQAALRRAGEHLASLGITTVHHMAYEPARNWRQLALAASREGFPLRVWGCIDQQHIEAAAALGLATGQGGARFTVGGAKFFADGAIGSLTAWMLEPYAGTDTVGVCVHGPELLRERFPQALEAGLTLVTHAIGDAANRAVLDALEATRNQWQAVGLRPRLEHAQHLHPDDVGRFAELGVVASMQPIHLTFDAKRVGELLAERVSGAYRTRSLLASGAVLAFGSDTPVASPDVIEGLRAACTREAVGGGTLNVGEALTVEEALAAYTRGAAYAIGREGRSGVLKPGFDADLVVLSHDPTDETAGGLAGLEVRGTMLAGSWTHALQVGAL